MDPLEVLSLEVEALFRELMPQYLLSMLETE
jgi:hypothetical protein